MNWSDAIKELEKLPCPDIPQYVTIQYQGVDKRWVYLCTALSGNVEFILSALRRQHPHMRFRKEVNHA